MSTSGKARLVLVGMGGIGCPAAWSLCAGTAGELVLIDDDVVDVSNLQRQILYATSDVGRPKVEAARDALLARYPAQRIIAVRARLTPVNADALLARADVVFDGTDDTPTKFVLNDLCVARGLPLVSAGAVGWRGQLLAVLPGGPCLRCLFEEPPEDATTCALAGILGAWAGVIGARAAMMAQSITVDPDNVMNTFSRDYLALDGWLGEVRHVTFRPRRGCPACAAATPVRCRPFRGDRPPMAKVRIPTPLRKYTAGAEEVVIEGKNVGELLANLETSHPGIKERIFDDKGAVRRFVNIFVRDEDIRTLQQLETPIADNDEVSIVPAIAGGSEG
jgi:molybdopterin/thiamine biosynthesis adenylyltransferase/molybdopterin converting factor small subunit